MTQDSIGRLREVRGTRRVADVALIATTAALFVSLIVAMTAVSIGIARADTLSDLAESGGGRLALAVVLAFVIAGMGLLTALKASSGERGARRD